MFSKIERIPMLPTDSPLDPVVLLVACRKLDEAEELASDRLTRLTRATPVDRLAAARATRALADILLEAGKNQQAAPHVFEARRRYRPFRNDPALSAEVDLTLAEYAFADDHSYEGEQILTEATARSADVPGAELPHARLLRYSAHIQIVRVELEKGDALMTEAVQVAQRAVQTARSTSRAAAAEPLLLLSQYLFTHGEVAFMKDDPTRARALVSAALDLTETELREYSEYVRFARGRAAHAHRVFGDMTTAEELEARAEGRHG